MGRSGVDLLADDDDSNTVLPKVIAAAAIVLVFAIGAIFFGVSNLNKQPEAPVATNSAPIAPVKEVFTDNRIAAVQTSYVPPPPRVFLPPSVNPMVDSFRNGGFETIPSGRSGPDAKLLREDKGVQFGIAGAKLINSKKPNGESICYGAVKIFNRSIDNIVDFEIVLVSGKNRYQVKPFVGTLDNMESLVTHVVHAKEALSIPVVVENYKGAPGPVEGKLTVIATLDSTPKPQYFEMNLGKATPVVTVSKSKKR